MLKKLVQQGPQRAKRRGVRGWYVEALSEARTTLAGFYSILNLADRHSTPFGIVHESALLLLLKLPLRRRYVKEVAFHRVKLPA